MKMSKNSVLVVILLLVGAGNIQGMATDVFPLNKLPRELQRSVLVIALNNEINSLPVAKGSLAIAGKKIRDFVVINKDFEKVINQPQFCLELIKNLATKFKKSDEETAKALGTKCAQDRFKLQNEFLDFIEASKESFLMSQLEAFIKRGVDVDFTDEVYEAKPLQRAVQLKNLDMISALIAKGADVNSPNRNGFTPLYVAIQDSYSQKKTEKKERQVKIIKMLLKAGADSDKMTTDVKTKREMQKAEAFIEAKRQLDLEKSSR